MSQLIELWEMRAVPNSRFANNQHGFAEHCLQRTMPPWMAGGVAGEMDRPAVGLSSGCALLGTNAALRDAQFELPQKNRDPNGSLYFLARPERFELPTARFVAEYSIQLSYGRIVYMSRLEAAPTSLFIRA